jgi:hypothetical protein
LISLEFGPWLLDLGRVPPRKVSWFVGKKKGLIPRLRTVEKEAIRSARLRLRKKYRRGR